MATYVIGDVQGCYQQLLHLLEAIEFEPKQDMLWFTGDLVNRGPDSLKTLRLLYHLEDRVKIVLGNHDLHLLAVAHGCKALSPSDTLDSILKAKDKHDLLDWLSSLPLFYFDTVHDCGLVHAGVPPQWHLVDALGYSAEVEYHLAEEKKSFLNNMYGNHPSKWHKDLEGWDRLRYITNAFTRMRFCTVTGHLDMSVKGNLECESQHIVAWFHHPKRKAKKDTIVFGHWAALEAKTGLDNVIAVDAGCIWGGHLMAYCLETKKRYTVAGYYR